MIFHSCHSSGNIFQLLVQRFPDVRDHVWHGVLQSWHEPVVCKLSRTTQILEAFGIIKFIYLSLASISIRWVSNQRCSEELQTKWRRISIEFTCFRLENWEAPSGHPASQGLDLLFIWKHTWAAGPLLPAIRTRSSTWHPAKLAWAGGQYAKKHKQILEAFIITKLIPNLWLARVSILWASNWHWSEDRQAKEVLISID